MHYLVVAKVKDYPDVDTLMCALTHHNSSKSGTSGIWKYIAGSIEEFASSNRDDIISEIDDEDMCFEDKVSTYIELGGFRIDSNGVVWQKISDHFDYCVFGGRFVNKNLENVVPYQKVIDEYGKVAAFVLPEYDFYYTDEKQCPFKPDDLVYIIDGHN